jgi:hypothetical protein
MSDPATVNQWLDELSAEQNLGRLVLNDHDSCVFTWHSRFKLCVELAGDGNLLRLFTPILAVPVRQRLAFYQTLLEFNMLGQKTNGAVVSLDPDGRMAVLGYEHPAGQLDSETFVGLVDNFVSSAAGLQQNLKSSIEVAGQSGERDAEAWIHSHPQFLA